MQQIEVVIFGHFRHARGQRQRVRRKFKQWIIRDRDFVKMNSLFAAAEAKWLRVGDEMNVMAAIGQLDSQLRGDYAAAAIGGITGDADFHMRSLSACIDAGRRRAGYLFLRFKTADGALLVLAEVDEFDRESEVAKHGWKLSASAASSIWRDCCRRVRVAINSSSM